MYKDVNQRVPSPTMKYPHGGLRITTVVFKRRLNISESAGAHLLFRILYEGREFL
jgi:hypothetical protein